MEHSKKSALVGTVSSEDYYEPNKDILFMPVPPKKVMWSWCTSCGEAIGISQQGLDDFIKGVKKFNISSNIDLKDYFVKINGCSEGCMEKDTKVKLELVKKSDLL